MTTIRHTADIDERFDRAFLRACEKIECLPVHLLGVMFSESGCRPSAHNRNGNAVGLIQFMPATLRALGWKDGHEAFKHLAASQQLPYVAAYFAPWHRAGRPWDTAARLYQACFLPATLANKRAPSDVIAARGGPLGWAYEANTVLDRDGDRRITIAELDLAIQRNARGPRWREMLARLGIAEDADRVLDASDALSAALAADDPRAELDRLIRTPRGLQAALAKLGYNLGVHGVDGFVGANTRAAIRVFQVERGLVSDGIVGPFTRAELVAALMTAQ